MLVQVCQIMNENFSFAQVFVSSGKISLIAHEEPKKREFLGVNRLKPLLIQSKVVSRELSFYATDRISHVYLSSESDNEFTKVTHIKVCYDGCGDNVFKVYFDESGCATIELLEFEPELTYTFEFDIENLHRRVMSCVALSERIIDNRMISENIL